MKCPHCGTSEQQQQLKELEPCTAGYRCPKCGCLYVAASGMDAIINRLNELKAIADASARQQEEFARRLAEFERDFKAAGG